MAVFVLDSFTASGGAQGSPGDNLTAHTGETGATWTDINSGAKADFMLTDAGRIRAEPGGSETGAHYHASGVPPTADYYVQATLHKLTTLSTQSLGIRARSTPAAGNWYMLYYDGDSGNVYFWRVLAHTDQVILGIYAWPLADGASGVMRLELLGASLSVYLGGALQDTVTNSAIPAAGAVGVHGFIYGAGSHTTGLHLDNFSAGTLGAEPGLVPRPQSRWRSVRR